jgi:hypothetical protein
MRQPEAATLAASLFILPWPDQIGDAADPGNPSTGVLSYLVTSTSWTES